MPELQVDNFEQEIKVCPVMTCDSCLLFPEIDLPCAHHGILMVPISQQPLRKTVYRFIKSRLLHYKYVTHIRRRS